MQGAMVLCWDHGPFQCFRLPAERVEWREG